MNGANTPHAHPAGAAVGQMATGVQLSKDELLDMHRKQTEMQARNTALSAALGLNKDSELNMDASELIDCADAIKHYLIDGGTITTGGEPPVNAEANTAAAS